MFKVGSIVAHKRDICKITEIVKQFRLDEDYYTLIPIEDSSLIIHTPVSNKQGLIRDIISKKDAEALIESIPEIKVIEFIDDRTLEGDYISLINSGKPENLVRVIKTTYVRNEDRVNNGQNAGKKDRDYFNLAEKLFYTELSIALGKSYAQTKEYIIDKVAIPEL